MRLHLLTLTFQSPYERLEKPFFFHYYETMKRQIRIGSIVAALFCILFSINDFFILPEKFEFYLKIRLFMMAAPCLAVTLMTFSKHYSTLIEPAIWIVAFLVGLGTTMIVVFAPPEKFVFFFLGYVQILFFLFTFVRLRFLWATSVTWLLLFIYLISALIVDILPDSFIITVFVGLVCILIMGMLTSYAMEYNSRRNFFLSRQLESKKRRLSVANQYLEERVNRRTAELTQANSRLQMEVRERKSIAKDLINSKSRYRSMVDNVSDFICVHDTEGYILEANHRMLVGLGYVTEDLIGLHMKQLMSVEDHLKFDRYISRIMEQGSDQGVISLVAQDGRSRLLEFSSVIADQDSSSKAVYCLARDLTEKRLADLALAESQARFKDIFETASAGMMIVEDETQTVIEINPAAAQMFGQPAEMIKGQPINKLIRSAKQDEIQQTSETIGDPEEWELLSKLDGPIPILKTMRPIEFDGRDHWVLSINSLQKVKEAESIKHEMQQQLMQSQHLQAIGTLAGGIAHDFNNILFGILGYTQLAMDDAPEGSLLKSNLGEVMKGGQRAMDLIAQILAFGRRGGAEKTVFDPRPLINEALKLLRASIPTTIEMKIDIPSDVQSIHANTTQLHQVVMNLCTNAAHALQPNGGLLSVVVKNINIDTEEKSPTGDLKQGKYLRLSVIDNGTGMDRQIINRIFEPFFTTKSQGQGAGMGLSMVLGIVQDHGGAIRVSSRLGQGTRFDVFLPAAEVVGKFDVVDEAKPMAGTEHILFVDDEFPLIQMGRQMLSRLGYKVHVYQNALEALDFFKQNSNLIDLVITDLTMPKINGIELALRIHRTRSDLPIILCTGNAEGIDLDALSDIGVSELITKPILRNDLAKAIRNALNSVMKQEVMPISQAG